MEQKQKGALPKIEIIIVGVFVLSFLIWMVPKCGGGGEKVDPLAEEDEIETDADTAKVTKPIPVVPPTDTTAAKQPATPRPTQTQQPAYSKLYVTIEGLNLRKEPGLKATVVAKLALFEEVYFLNEVTDSTTELSLGKEVAREPWVKVKTMKGQEGWVFGAGVNYYKKKRPGTLE